MKILFKNITALNKDEYLELIKFHGKKNNLKYYSYTAVMGLILIIGMSYQIILKNYVSLILLALIFIGFLAYRFIEPYSCLLYTSKESILYFIKFFLSR